MKAIKKLAYILMALMIALCAAVLICALNPSLTKKVANLVDRIKGVSTGESLQQESVWVPTGVASDYVVPKELPDALPMEVEHLLGFEPVTGEEQEINQTEADNLSQILSQGSLGSEYAFSEETYPYYGMLDSDLRQLYHQVYANAMELNTSFVPVLAVTANQAKRVVEAVYYDHPELFWLDGKYSCKYMSTGICVEITLCYNSLIRDLDRAKSDFEKCAEEILQGTESMESLQDKERYIHDVLLRIVVYDKNADWNQSAYSAIVRGNTVCAGYTKAFQYLMQSLGVPCYYCTGYAGEDHAWNIIKMDGAFYNTDVTWDDTDPATYDYYNKTDDVFGATHVRTGMSVYLPACMKKDVSPIEESSEGSEIDAYINPNPQVPLSWQSRGEKDSVESPQDSFEEELKKLGIEPKIYAASMDEYLKLGGEELKLAGKGSQQFIIVIPEGLWGEVERLYSSGDFRKGYVEKTIKELGVESFSIQLQVQRLGNGYYKLYHNVYTE